MDDVEWEAARAAFNRGPDRPRPRTPEAPGRAPLRVPRWSMPDVDLERLGPLGWSLAEIGAGWWSWWTLASTADHHGLPQWVILLPFLIVFLQGVK